MILVTGATGHLGSAVIEQLVKTVSPATIAGLARNEDKTQMLRDKGVQVRMGDFDDAASLHQAVEGVNTILLISTVDPHRYQQHQNLIDAAKAAGVQHIAYTSALIRDWNSSAVKTHLESHFQTENYLRESGLHYTIFRNSLYADMIPVYAGEKVFEKGIYLPAGNGKVAYALRREMGEAIANTLLQNDTESIIYELTGSALYSYDDIAKALSEIAGKDVPYTNADALAFPGELRQLEVPERMIAIAAGFTTDIRDRQYETVSTDLELLLGRKPKTLQDALEEIYASRI